MDHNFCPEWLGSSLFRRFRIDGQDVYQAVDALYAMCEV